MFLWVLIKRTPSLGWEIEWPLLQRWRWPRGGPIITSRLATFQDLPDPPNAREMCGRQRGFDLARLQSVRPVCRPEASAGQSPWGPGLSDPVEPQSCPLTPDHLQTPGTGQMKARGVGVPTWPPAHPHGRVRVGHQGMGRVRPLCGRSVSFSVSLGCPVT